MIERTSFHYNVNCGSFSGKVRDCYRFGNTIAMVSTDRLSAFDCVLNGTIAHKGQILNQISAFNMALVRDQVPCWLESYDKGCVSIGKYCQTIPLEIIVRGSLMGSAWKNYQAGVRLFGDVTLPDNLVEFDSLPQLLITPTTKARSGPDLPITAEQIFAQNLLTRQEYQQVCDWAKRLFNLGQKHAQSRQLILADSKYEFGRFDDKLWLIDELHTPDSSRYLFAIDYEQRRQQGLKPRQLSREFIKSWHKERGFEGKPGQITPVMDPQFRQQISQYYIDCYEKITEMTFVSYHAGDEVAQAQATITKFAQSQSTI